MGAPIPPHLRQSLVSFEPMMDQTACKPGSVPRPKARDGHSSRPSLAAGLWRPTRTSRARDGPTPLRGRDIPIRSCSRRGLPCRRCHHRRGGLLPHPFTLALRRSLRSFEGRFAFCGAIPEVTPGGRYPPPCRCGARTFLDAVKRRDRPAVWSEGTSGPRGRRRQPATRPNTIWSQ